MSGENNSFSGTANSLIRVHFNITDNQNLEPKYPQTSNEQSQQEQNPRSIIRRHRRWRPLPPTIPVKQTRWQQYRRISEFDEDSLWLLVRSLPASQFDKHLLRLLDTYAVKSQRAVYEAYMRQLYTVEKCTRVQTDTYKELGLLEQRKRENLRRMRQFIKEGPSSPASGRTISDRPGFVHTAYGYAPSATALSDRGVNAGQVAASHARRLRVRGGATQLPPNGPSSADVDSAETQQSDTNSRSAKQHVNRPHFSEATSSRERPDVLVLDETEAEERSSSISSDRTRVQTGHSRSLTCSVSRSSRQHTAAASTLPPPVPLTKKQQELEVNLARIRESTRTAHAGRQHFDRLLNQVLAEPYRTYNLVAISGKRPPIEALHHQLVNNPNAFKLSERLNPPVTFPAIGML